MMARENDQTGSGAEGDLLDESKMRFDRDEDEYDVSSIGSLNDYQNQFKMVMSHESPPSQLKRED